MTNLRIGNGYDVHRLAEGLPLWLGGVHIPHTHGCVAHSDGDVLIHAICDALLGALARKDIGTHFPDTDPAFKAIDSKLLLIRCAELVRQNGYEIGNIDSILALQQPKIAPYIDRMQQTLAQTLGIASQQISVKATTTEHLGFVGRKEGITAYAVVLLQYTGLPTP